MAKKKSGNSTKKRMTMATKKSGKASGKKKVMMKKAMKKTKGGDGGTPVLSPNVNYVPSLSVGVKGKF